MDNSKCPKCGRKMIWIENYIALDGFWKCKNKKCEIVYQTRLDILLEKFQKRGNYFEYDLGKFDDISSARIEYKNKNNKFVIMNYYLDLPISLSIAEDIVEYLSKPIK